MSLTDEMTVKLALAERKLAALTAEVARNDDKMRRSQQRELRLLQADDLGSLIGEMLLGLRASYGLEYVSVVLCDPDHDIRHLLLAAGAPAQEFDNLVLVESMTGMAPQYVALRRPWFGAYSACDHQLVWPGASGLASIAMIPLTHRQQLFGSINLGSKDEERFTRAHAADFLAHLGIIASFCIENVVNRARLLRSGFTDVLTGWHNRRYLQVRIKEELARSRREQCHLACLMLDIDHFKRVNDTWGHRTLPAMPFFRSLQIALTPRFAPAMSPRVMEEKNLSCCSRILILLRRHCLPSAFTRRFRGRRTICRAATLYKLRRLSESLVCAPSRRLMT